MAQAPQRLACANAMMDGHPILGKRPAHIALTHRAERGATTEDCNETVEAISFVRAAHGVDGLFAP